MGTVVYKEFEWDEEKNRGNVEKHGISFYQACYVFSASYAKIDIPDKGHGEKRVMAIGLLDDVEVTVIYTERKSRKRIISARRARQNERKTYWEATPE